MWITVLVQQDLKSVQRSIYTLELFSITSDIDLISSVNGVNWKLFRGTVATWTVLSFVAPSEITNFNQDLKPFFSSLSFLNSYLRDYPNQVP